MGLFKFPLQARLFRFRGGSFGDVVDHTDNDGICCAAGITNMHRLLLYYPLHTIRSNNSVNDLPGLVAPRSRDVTAFNPLPVIWMDHTQKQLEAWRSCFFFQS